MAQGHRVLAPFSYIGPVAQAIHRLKYNNRPELARSLCQPMAKLLLRAEIRPGSVLVPVPATPSRIVERGYNQSALLARALSQHAGLVCRPTGLKRTHFAPHQVGADKAMRAQQVAGAFAANAKTLAKANVLLVDDVVTTGATSAACAQALEDVGARLVAVVAVARVL
jgi:ComF family protein